MPAPPVAKTRPGRLARRDGVSRGLAWWLAGLLAVLPWSSQAAGRPMGLPAWAINRGIGLGHGLGLGLGQGLGRSGELPLPAQLAQRLVDSRKQAVDKLVQGHPALIDLDPAGAPMRRGELVLLDPSAALLDGALAAGFVSLRRTELPGLGIVALVLGIPAGLSNADALAALRRLDPAASIDFNHLYQASAVGGASPRDGALAAQTPAASSKDGGRVGLIDAGVDPAHPALKSLALHRWGCAQPHPTEHGTAVASLLVGEAPGFVGAAAGFELFAADVYCDDPAGGSAEAVVRALDGMARERVPVINLSLVGPPNRLLERAVRAMVARGHLLVAAVGNDGPASPPLYPAAYDGVVAVTGVDRRRRVLPEACRGPHVQFAAPGSQMAAAALGGPGFETVRGTSFAAPLVAGLLARLLPRPDPRGARDAVAALAASARDLGEPGRDPVFGVGLVGESLRIDADDLP